MTNKPWPVFIFIPNFITAIFLFFTFNAISVRNPALMQKIEWFHGNKMKIWQLLRRGLASFDCSLFSREFQLLENTHTHNFNSEKKTSLTFDLVWSWRVASVLLTWLLLCTCHTISNAVIFIHVDFTNSRTKSINRFNAMKNHIYKKIGVRHIFTPKTLTPYKLRL